MAKNNNLGDFLKSLADKFRSKLSTTASINPQDFESKVDEVYSQGKREEYDAFWDNFQQNGSPADGYEYAFMYRHWNDANFKPKYNINGKKFYMAFYGTGIKDIPACLERQGVILDTSQANAVDRIFALTKTEVIPSIDVRNITKELHLYDSSWYCHTIGTLILKDDGSQKFNNNCFYDLPALVNFTVEGVIGNNINFKWSPKLSKDSITSIITHLSTTQGATLTLSAAAVNTGFPGEGEWELFLAENKPDVWTINLV